MTQPKSKTKKPTRPEPEGIEQFEGNVHCELETVKEIALYLYPYGGRVRERILAHVNELLAYTEE